MHIYVAIESTIFNKNMHVHIKVVKSNTQKDNI